VGHGVISFSTNIPSLRDDGTRCDFIFYQHFVSNGTVRNFVVHPNSVIKDYLTTAADGKKSVSFFVFSRHLNRQKNKCTWETLYNPNFKHIKFDVFKSKAGLNAFVLSPTQWIEKTNAIGLVVKSERYGGTFECVAGS